MKKYIYLVFIGLILIGCEKTSEQVQEKSSSENIETPTTKVENCIPYFDFDEVEYFHIDISTEKILKLSKSKNDSLLFSIINRRTFSKISDTLLIDKLSELGFLNKKISEKDNQELNKFFCQKESLEEDMAVSACDPLYKDILVFRKSNEVIGIAKLCFSCGQSLIVNQKQQLPPISSDKNWKDLSTLLKKYK